MRVREYGTSGPCVALLHGGPGAPGYMAPVATRLASACRVFEPFQRGSGGEPLTVARHVADLDDVLTARCRDAACAIVGHSWGAMLALAYAAAHPDRVASLVLVGCGTFTLNARARMHAILEARTDADLRQRLDRLLVECVDPNERLQQHALLTLPLYSHDLGTVNPEFEACDARAHHETWSDMMRLEEEGVYPAAFKTITMPVLMLHGAADPHPGPMIHASLAPHLPQLTYVEWDHCGHYPWLERATRDEFFAVLTPWLERHTGG